MHRLSARRDCIVYSAKCDKLDGITVVLKVYDKSRISPVKHRSVRREARIMRFLTERGCVLATAQPPPLPTPTVQLPCPLTA
jgi:hypothetical protein